jgi:hypothetical protein
VACPPTRCGRPTPIAQAPWYQPERVFKALEALYPVPQGKTMRAVPYMPYLQVAPSAWVLPLKFDGGGYRAGGKAMFDAEGNLWVGNNFTVGWQASDALWQGNATKFDPNGKPLSPITTGFTGGGMQGGTFGAAIDLKGNVWLASYGSMSITVFDKDGKPLTPPDGINFGGRLGLMQGIITAPDGDVWGAGRVQAAATALPEGRLEQRPHRLRRRQRRTLQVLHRAVPSGHRPAEPHLGVGQFLARDSLPGGRPGPGAEARRALQQQRPEYRQPGQRLGHQPLRLRPAWHGAHGRHGGAPEDRGVLSASDYLTKTMSEQKGGSGSITVLRPDGTPLRGSPFKGGGLPGPWAVVVDGNDNLWVSNFAMPASPIVQLCGVRTEHCPPGFKTGDQIAPPGGYVGGGLQLQTDIAIGPAGDVWAMNNWQDIDSCYPGATEALSTRCGGQGVVIFFGMAKPVRAPQIGPARPF